MMDDVRPMLREWLASLRQLVAGPATLERTLSLTIVGLVLFSILVLAVSAVGLLRKQAEQQAIARVQLAGASAREELRRFGEDTLTSVRVLSTRPTLQRLIRAGNREQVELFLKRACNAMTLQACAVTVGSTVLASTRPDVEWLEVAEAAADQGERFMLAPRWQPDGLLGTMAMLPNFVETRVYGLRYFDDAMARSLTEQSRTTIRLVQLSNWLDNVEPDFKALHSTALSRAESFASRISGKDLYASSTPIFASTGEGIALIEARVPASESDAAVAGFVRRLGWTTFILALGAVAAALVLARRITRPLQSVTESAMQLGRGDFSASIPVTGGGPEVNALARTLEDMRRHLVDATTTCLLYTSPSPRDS